MSRYPLADLHPSNIPLIWKLIRSMNSTPTWVHLTRLIEHHQWRATHAIMRTPSNADKNGIEHTYIYIADDSSNFLRLAFVVTARSSSRSLDHPLQHCWTLTHSLSEISSTEIERLPRVRGFFSAFDTGTVTCS